MSWQDRVIQEQADLEEKIDKLQTMIASAGFLDFAEDVQDLLRAQLSTMETYSQLLGMRIKLF